MYSVRICLSFSLDGTAGKEPHVGATSLNISAVYLRRVQQGRYCEISATIGYATDTPLTRNT